MRLLKKLTKDKDTIPDLLTVDMITFQNIPCYYKNINLSLKRLSRLGGEYFT
jgi:hypothetical protein